MVLIREMSEVQTGRFCYLPGDNFDKVTVSESVKKKVSLGLPVRIADPTQIFNTDIRC